MNTERLFFLREECDLTQEEMGKIVGTKKYSICNWEKGKEIIPLSKLNEYSNYFNVSIDYILKLSDNKNKMINKCALDKNKIGSNIKNIRENNSLTQRQLAEILNTTHSAIWAYENGKAMILTAFAYQICKEFNISMDYLCGKTKDSEMK